MSRPFDVLRAALLVAATAVAPADAAERPPRDPVRAEFVELDANSDGRLSRTEFLKGVSRKQLKGAWFTAWDSDRDRFLTLAEFRNGRTPPARPRTIADWNRYYKRLDADSNGRIDLKESHRAVRDGHLESGWLRQYDKNRDGLLSKAEFLGGLRKAGKVVRQSQG